MMKKILLAAVFALGLAGGVSHAAAVAGDDIPCKACHSQTVEKFLQSRHGTDNPKFPGGLRDGNQCAMCHGETLKHMASAGKEKPEFTFKKGKNGLPETGDAEKYNKVCMTCHSSSAARHWTGSRHEANGVACVSCHGMHKADVALNPKTKTALCISCHKEKKSDLHKHFNHPLKDGQMSCTSCHAPHGNSTGEALLKKGEINKTCYSCHPGKRGPFLHTHPPVTENCLSCHAPHGSNKRPMLNAREPYLCQSCHPASSMMYHGGYVKGGRDADHTSTRMQNGCLACHPAIHGSNHPGGNLFRR